MAQANPLVVLFGYESSTFTIKVRLVLKLKGIQYSFVTVPSMMPRAILRDAFHLTYRKIPVLAIGRDLYCDTSLICEALEHHFGEAQGYKTLYPKSADGMRNRALIRGFASYWTDRPLFRATTGLIPASVWRTSFGKDRAQLIGHPLDAEKLERKLPENISRLDMHLSMLEDLFSEGREWLMSTAAPSLADVSLWYQLKWGTDIAKGHLIDNLTAGGTQATSGSGVDIVFNSQRYPALLSWYKQFDKYMESLKDVETHEHDFEDVIRRMNDTSIAQPNNPLLPTPQPSLETLDGRCGLQRGVEISVSPDDTGRADPTIGTLLAISPEEVVLQPRALEGLPRVDVKIHFPRLGFVVRPVVQSKL